MKLALKYLMVLGLLFLHGYNIVSAGIYPVSFGYAPAQHSRNNNGIEFNGEQGTPGFLLYALWDEDDDDDNEDNDEFISADDDELASLQEKVLSPGYLAILTDTFDVSCTSFGLKNSTRLYDHFSLFPDKYIFIRTLRI